MADLAREHGISEVTIYTWKSKYGGLEVSEAQSLKSLEEEVNLARQKPLYGYRRLHAPLVRRGQSSPQRAYDSVGSTAPQFQMGKEVSGIVFSFSQGSTLGSSRSGCLYLNNIKIF